MHNMKHAQVVRVDYQQYTATCDQQTYTLQLSGRFHYQALNKEDYPVVGDYVWFHEMDELSGIIERVDTRKSVLKRLARTTTHDAQILAANVDIAFICLSCNQDFNLKKVQNLLNMTYSDNISQIILLTKKDITDDLSYYVDQVRLITQAQTLPLSVYDDVSMEKLKHIIGTSTCVLIGASGVGKSTIINCLLGLDYLATQDTRHTDDQGRHTTTHRELLVLPDGGTIIDTPGMRELDAYMVHDIEHHFSDIVQFAQQCRFRDCTHTDEPGCHIQEAIDDGLLTEERLIQYNRALKQTAYAMKKEMEKKRILNKKQYRS